MAVMSPNALLTKRSKPILALSLVKPLRILLPRTRFLRHRIETASSSRGDGPQVWCKSSSLASGPSLAIWLRPYHQAPTSVGASFFCAIAPPGRRSISMRICMAALPIVRLCRSRPYRILHSTAGFVVTPPPPRSAAPAKDRTAPSIPSGGAFFALCSPRCWINGSPHRTPGCVSPPHPAPHCSPHS
jgi:hypothetical protein